MILKYIVYFLSALLQLYLLKFEVFKSGWFPWQGKSEDHNQDFRHTDTTDSLSFRKRDNLCWLSLFHTDPLEKVEKTLLFVRSWHKLPSYEIEILQNLAFSFKTFEKVLFWHPAFGKNQSSFRKHIHNQFGKHFRNKQHSKAQRSSFDFLQTSA